MSDDGAMPQAELDEETLIRQMSAAAVEFGWNRFPPPGPALDVADEPVRRWEPPTTNDEDEDALGILPTLGCGFAFQRMAAKARLRELPDPLRRIVGKLRTDVLRLQVLDQIEARVEHEAIEACVHKNVMGWVGDLSATPYVPAIRRRQILRLLASKREFVQGAQELVTETLRQGHVHHVWRTWPRPLPRRLPVTKLSASGIVTVESWAGLGAETLPETAPEGLLVLLARRVWRPHRGQQGSRRNERSLGWILHAGAQASTFTLALMATAPEGLRWEVCELDNVGEPLSIPWIRWRSHELPAKADAAAIELKPFKVAFVHVPPPGSNANQLRNRAKDLASPPHEDEQRRLPDVGRLGPRKWKTKLRASLKEAIKSLHTPGELFLLLPTATRTNEIKNGRVEWRYQSDASLLEGVRELLLGEGLTIDVDVAVCESNPVRQPFFGFDRCPWRLIIARRSRGEHHVETDEELEELLGVLEDQL